MPGSGAELQAQEDVFVPNDQTESEDSNLSTDDGSDPPSDDEGGWEAAKEAYQRFNPKDHDVDGGGKDTSQATDKADGEGGSHLEADGADQTKEQKEEEQKTDGLELDLKYSLDDLKLPNKYKPFVQEKVDAILAEAKAKASHLNQGYKESNLAFAKAFVDVIQSDNPLQTLREYAEQVVPAFGLPEDILSKFADKTNGGGVEPPSEEPRLDVAGIQQRFNEEIARIEEKYWPQLEKEDDPRRARELFSLMEREKMSLHGAVQNAQLKAVLQAFYGKLIKPQFDEFGKIKSHAERERAVAERQNKVGRWNSADQEMGKKFGDWSKYKAKVKDLIKSKYDSQKESVNRTGQGHFELMRDLYLIASRQDHLEAAKRPQRGLPGLKSSGKHITTQKAGGSGWDDIKGNLWNDVIPDD